MTLYFILDPANVMAKRVDLMTMEAKLVKTVLFDKYNNSSSFCIS